MGRKRVILVMLNFLAILLLWVPPLKLLCERSKSTRARREKREMEVRLGGRSYERSAPDFKPLPLLISNLRASAKRSPNVVANLYFIATGAYNHSSCGFHDLHIACTLHTHTLLSVFLAIAPSYSTHAFKEHLTLGRIL